MLRAKKLRSIPANLLAILISAIMFVPIYLLLVNSLKDSIQSRAMGVELPSRLHLENYLTVIERGKLGAAFVNSLLYATGATILVVLFATAAAFVLSRHRSPWVSIQRMHRLEKQRRKFWWLHIRRESPQPC